MTEMFLDPADLNDPERLVALGFAHNPVTALVLPRPIAWISTMAADGVANLAPFSFTGMVSQSPPMVMFCANATHPEGGDKDTLKNVRETGEFVYNMATFDLRHAMNTSSTPLARRLDEFELAGLEKGTCHVVRPPRVAQSPISLECKVVTIVDLPRDERTGARNTATIGQVVGIHIKNDLIRDGIVDVMQSRPLARLGYLDYATCGDVFTMPRPPAGTGDRDVKDH